MTSRPLFISVAESTEILRPITQFGCAQACVGRDRRRASRRRACGTGRRTRSARCGARRRRRAGSRAGRHWKIGVVLAVDRQQLGAARRAPRRRTARRAMTSASLFASSRRLPARAAASVDASPAAPTIAAITVSHVGQLRDFARAPARRRTRVGDRAARKASRSARFARCIGEHREARPMKRRKARAARRRCDARRARTTSKRSGMARDDVERARADRAGGAEDRDGSCHGPQVRPAASATTGSAANSASMRSSMPPWPGNSVPLNP